MFLKNVLRQLYLHVYQANDKKKKAYLYRFKRKIQYCKDKGLKVIEKFSIDESSTHGDRAVFHKMINFAAGCEGKVAIVVAYVDRLQRLPEDSYYVESLRRSGKVEIHFIKERLIITKDSAATELTFWNMFVMFANAQVNSQTDKIKASQAKNWADGKWQGTAPLGYLNKKMMTINP